MMVRKIGESGSGCFARLQMGWNGLMFHNLFDSHSHSENSIDGAHSVTFMMEAAVTVGLQGLAVTDHFDVDYDADYQCSERLRQMALDVAMTREAFRQQIILTTGIELGQAAFDYTAAERALRLAHFDFVLLALHRVQRRWKDFYRMNFSKVSPDELHAILTAYFDEMAESVRWGQFDALAHMTLPLRYILRTGGPQAELERYRERIEEILELLVKENKALELNLSGIWAPPGESMPPQWVVRRFGELGGKYVTLGSDAHSADHLGGGLQEGMALLQEAGFTHFTFYRDRTPVLLRII